MLGNVYNIKLPHLVSQLKLLVIILAQVSGGDGIREGLEFESEHFDKVEI